MCLRSLLDPGQRAQHLAGLNIESLNQWDCIGYNRSGSQWDHFVYMLVDLGPQGLIHYYIPFIIGQGSPTDFNK